MGSSLAVSIPARPYSKLILAKKLFFFRPLGASPSPKCEKKEKNKANANDNAKSTSISFIRGEVHLSLVLEQMSILSYLGLLERLSRIMYLKNKLKRITKMKSK